MLCTPEAPVVLAEPVDNKIVMYGEIMSKDAINKHIGQIMDFDEELFRQYYPGTGNYVFKWHVSQENVSSDAVATVHFAGGDVSNDKNWTIVSVSLQ